MDDWQCLREFVEKGSQEAFGRLISRYIDLVYSAALRQVKDTHLAEDVAQTVFIALAAKARRLRQDSSLAGWLLITTRFAALDALKARARRARHEREAAMRDMQQDKDEHDAWQAIADQLDVVLSELNARDREAITLRYFQDKSFNEVADALGLTVEAARQRVHRATERMKTFFTRRGVAISADVIGPIILANAVHKAPPGLAALVLHKAASATAGSITGTLAGKGIGLTMASLNTKIVAGAAVLILLSGGAVVAYKQIAPPSGRVITIQNGRSGGQATTATDVPLQVEGKLASAAASLDALQGTYHLDEGQVLKRVSPPYTHERNTYLKSVMQGQPAMARATTGTDSSALFMFDDHAEWSMEIYQPFTVIGLAQSLAGLRGYDFQNLGDLAYLRMPGDWVIRKKSDPHARMATLAAIIDRDFGKNIQFVGRTVQKDVLVATGEVAIHTLPKEPFAGMIDIYTQRRSGDAISMAAGDVNALLGDVGQIMGMKILNEATPKSKQLFWRNFLKSGDLESSEARDMLLKNLSTQTGLHFAAEKRPVEVWYVEPAGATARHD